jgi:aldehyde dehydrogenase (NAD+)
MEKNQLQDVLEAQRKLFQSGKTKSLDNRIRLLNKLLKSIKFYTDEIHEALKKDLNKPELESFGGETFFVISDINDALANLKKWMKGKCVSSPVIFWPMKSRLRPEPLGNILIISPWNYPFQLLISPLVGAIAAGNTAILKPSELAPHTARLISKIIKETFSTSEVFVVEGGIPETTMLLEERFDHIFYTGNSHVAKIILEKAARYLTPVTLELGGKSPTIIFGEVDMEITVKRILFGKLYNLGQTCVSPDYILVEKRQKPAFVAGCIKYIEEFYGQDAPPNNSRIINKRHFERLKGLIGNDKILIGGNFDEQSLYISPTLLESSENSKAMSEEIFGPILPIIEIESVDQAIAIINRKEKPLALYLFSNDRQFQERIIKETSSGAVMINDSIIHIYSKKLPFGGIGQSGMGSYHGFNSFKAFSHFKPVIRRPFYLDNPLRYPPYPSWKIKLTKTFLKVLG